VVQEYKPGEIVPQTIIYTITHVLRMLGCRTR
jgi:hypothetical protein